MGSSQGMTSPFPMADSDSNDDIHFNSLGLELKKESDNNLIG